MAYSDEVTNAVSEWVLVVAPEDIRKNAAIIARTQMPPALENYLLPIIKDATVAGAATLWAWLDEPEEGRKWPSWHRTNQINWSFVAIDICTWTPVGEGS